MALAIAALLESEKTGRDGSDPWDDHSGWCLNGRWIRKLDWADEQGRQTVTLAYLKSGYRLSRPVSAVDGAPLESLVIHSLQQQGAHLSLVHDEGHLDGSVVREGEQFHVFTEGAHAVLTLIDPLTQSAVEEVQGGRLTAPMPGKIVAIHVGPGQSVEAGTPLLVMEAMKMEHTLNAPMAGTIGELLFAVGDQVGDGAQLLTLAPG
jgi:3-methylcrotonyl-CoA carboxylase alpha subunit